MSWYHTHLTGIGVDISDHHVRIAQMTLLGQLRALIEITLPEGLVRDEQIVEADALREIVETRMKKDGLMNGGIRTTVLVPESHVFSHSTILASSMAPDIRFVEARKRAQREIPIPFEQAVIAPSQGATVHAETRVNTYAVEKTVFDGLTRVFSPTHFRVLAMEANSKALQRLFLSHGLRALQVKESNGLIGIVDVGHSWATISVYLPDGSNVFSRSLTYEGGSSKSEPAELPQTTVESIHKTIQEVVVYFNKNQFTFRMFLFAGVEAQDKRFTPESEKMGSASRELFYRIGDVIHIDHLPKRDIHTFGAAIGASIRSVHHYLYKKQHNFIKLP